MVPLRLITFWAAIPVIVYLSLLSLLIACPTLQTHAFYLHRLSFVWSKDLNVPEAFGFLRGQVTPFSINTRDGETLHAWHVLPLELYRQHQQLLLAQPSGFTSNVRKKLSYQLLRNDPDARLVIYLHGTAGCLASGWRPSSYRALSAAAPDKIHVLTADYRGYGYSTGVPSEEGLLLDAIALVTWATEVAQIPPSRIVIFGQSLGTAVAISLTSHLAAQPSPTTFAGMVLVASFSDVATLTSTYRMGGVVPVLSPLARFPALLAFVNSFLQSPWLSKHRIAEFVRRCESDAVDGRYRIHFIHAEDDTSIGWQHGEQLFWHAVNATTATGVGCEREKGLRRTDFGAGGWAVDWRTEKGDIRLEMLKYGVHDILMAYPVTAMAVFSAFQAADREFGA